jgi:hypothetical protein
MYPRIRAKTETINVIIILLLAKVKKQAEFS